MTSSISNSSSISTSSSCFNDSTTPLAGWLTKMISLPFGTSCWISRYFVLLDSELRFYKDEHADSATQVLNLRKICQAIPVSTTQHPFCFRLEPQQNEGSIRPWIIECKSESDMESWIAAIQNRILKYTNNRHHTSSSSPASPMLPTIRTASILSIMTSPEVYCRTPILPLRCTNLTFSDDEEEQKEEEKASLLTRRNKTLTPIIITYQTPPSSPSQLIIEEEEEEEVAPQSSFSTSTFCSSTLPSPTGAVLGNSGRLISPAGINDRYNNSQQYKSSLPTLIISTKEALLYQQQQQQRKQQQCEEGEQSSSPTYLMYKKIFHL